ncbi:MAG: hypothetical protein D3904_12025 [Candidatus Electrothrix sp. EH2]|nr:hypothetical protein [Candidatus Electrothrix sp. EH2]
MRVKVSQFLKLFPYLEKNPSLSVALLALCVPVIMLFGAAKFSSAQIEALIFFGILGIVALIYSAWIVICFIGRIGRRQNESFFKEER